MIPASSIQVDQARRPVSQMVRWCYVFFISICFLMGWLLQFIGILSLTQTNYLALVFATCIYVVSKRTVEASDLIMLLTFAWIITVAIKHDNSVSEVLVYIYYLISPIIALFIGRKLGALCATNSQTTFRWIKRFIFLQLVMCIAQRLLFEPIFSHSAIQMNLVDSQSGTFFQKSDASVSGFCALFMITAISAKLSYRQTFQATALSLGAIFSTGSKAFQGIAIILIPAYWAYNRLLQKRKFGIKLTLLIVILPLIIYFGFPSASEVLANFIDQINSYYLDRYDHDRADRLAPLGAILGLEAGFWGRGLLSYYNPLSNSWDYYSGFSLIYSFYLDTGFVGLTLILLFFATFIRGSSVGGINFVAIMFIVFVFSMFSLSLTDLAFMFSLGFFSAIVGIHSKTQRSAADHNSSLPIDVAKYKTFKY